MKTISNLLLGIVCVFFLINNIQAQSPDHLIKTGGSPYQNSSIIETGDQAAKIGIGITGPIAKLHIAPTSPFSSVLRVDGIQYSGNLSNDLGFLEFWKKNGTFFYGIYQKQSQGPNTLVCNYLQNNLGIGVEIPKYILDVNGIIGCTGTSATGIKIDNTNQPFIFKYFSSSGSNGLPDQDISGEPISEEGDTATLSPLTIYSYGVKVQDYLQCTGTLTTQGLTIKNNAHPGSVFISNSNSGLGTWTDPAIFSIIGDGVRIGFNDNIYPDYKLAVNGKAICLEMKIKLKNNWPDYVFDRDYKLPSLEQVSKFIQTNNHLPEMPSAKEVSENGINVGEMNALLLKKVEELTLYVISLEKEMNLIKAKVASH